MNQDDVAVFIDLDNLAIGAAEAKLTFNVRFLLNYIREVTGGRIVLRLAYADWRQRPELLKNLAFAGFQLQSTVNFMDKNLADMQMVVDAMETLIDGQSYSTYVLVTGDRDFIPLVQTLRKRGKSVIGVGIKHTSSNSLRELCDQYIYYEDLLVTTKRANVENNQSLLAQALKVVLLNQSQVPASILKQKMDDLSNGQFVQSKAGRMSFKKFLQQFPDIVAIRHDGSTLYVGHVDTKDASQIQDEETKINVEEPVNIVQSNRKAQTSKSKEQKIDEKKKEEEPLHIQYKMALKRQKMRIVPASQRLLILYDVIDLLQKNEKLIWKETIQQIYDRHQEKKEASISKSLVSDVLNLMVEAKVIKFLSDSGRFYTSVPIGLNMESKKLFQESVMRCDTVYLHYIKQSEIPFDLESAALALYETGNYTRYLKVLHNKAQQFTKA